MDIIEKTLREALDLLDGVSVSGRVNRMRMATAEQKILAVVNGAEMAKKKTEAKKDAENRDGQGDV